MKRYLVVAIMLMSLTLVQTSRADEIGQVRLEAPIKVVYTLPAGGTFEHAHFAVEPHKGKKSKLSGFRYDRVRRGQGAEWSLYQVNGKLVKEQKIFRGGIVPLETEILSTAEYPVYTDAAPGSVTLTVSNAVTFLFKPPFITATPLPVFNEKRVTEILKKGILTYTIDIKSEYKPEAITSQFKSIALAEGVDRPNLFRKGQAIKVTHLLDQSIDCAVEVNPWHNGSKATVTFQVPITSATEDSNTVNAAPEIDAIIKKLTAIVND